MTIERQYGKIIFTCDVEESPRCEEQLETEASEWTAAREVFEEAGWRAFPRDRVAGAPTFIHCCKNCPVPR
jgi:hypothetical protein